MQFSVLVLGLYKLCGINCMLLLLGAGYLARVFVIGSQITRFAMNRL